jgi:putative membrane-bound dehydrogenase-like protein
MSLLLLAAFAAAPPGGERIVLNGQTFTLPAGFTIELATAPGLVQRPVAAALDDAGNLFVTEASGTNDPVAKQLKDRPHRLLRLTESKGSFNKATVFADRLMLPQGVMWKDGSVYVGAPPSIWKLTDTTGKGAAGRREEWFDGKTLTGCANDLHGPYAGPDGWIYWTKGAFAEQRYKRPGKPDLVTRASHLFRARPDGTGIEPVMTGGMDNPVDVVFTRGGERLVSCTFLQHPAGGLRDGILHAVYGGVYGKSHGVLDGHVRTSPHLMPVMTHLGAAAPCGLHRYESAAFGREYEDNVFCCLFNLHKVTRHVLTPKGATFTTSDSDFLVSDSKDFHPTDVIEDADGSLLVIDTGGWYKLCCPTSQLVKPEALGAIYRVRRKGSTGGRIKRPEDAVWAACRKEGEEARAFIRKKLEDRDATVRLAALHAVSVSRDAKALKALLRIVQDERHPHEQRAAAEALGRIGRPEAIAALAEVASRAECPVLRHSATYALIEIGDAAALRRLLKSPGLRGTALVALDWIGGGASADEVLPELGGPQAETSWWIAGRHPEWGARLAAVFREALAGKAPEALRRLPRFAGQPAIRGLLAERLREGDAAERSRALTAMLESAPRELPPEWGEPVATALASGREEIVEAALLLPPSPATKVALARLAGDARQPALYRLIAVQPGPLTGPIFDLALRHVQADADVATRSRAAKVLTTALLTSEQRLALARALPATGPMELGRLLEAFATSTDEKLGLAVLAAVRKSPVRSSLRPQQLREALAKMPAAVQKDLDEVIAELDAGAARQKEDLEKLLSSLEKGDVKRGQLVFNSTKAACASCHAIGYLGGKVGPDLTRIGRIRSARDLLESIVYPSASFVRSYEPVSVRTVKGLAYNGIVKSETGSEITLTVSATEELRIARGDIEEITPGKVSIMPAGMDRVLTRRELADLVAFLLACR